MDQNLADILESINFIKERMATKSDVAELRLELHTFRTESEGNFRSLHIELADINRRLDTLQDLYANLKGVTKEIDDIRADVRAIQKHIGLHRNIPA